MMKRPLFIHRMIFACALAILSLSCFVHAQETPAAEGPPAQTEDSGISTPRRVAGLGVLDRLDDLEEQFQPPEGRRP